MTTTQLADLGFINQQIDARTMLQMALLLARDTANLRETPSTRCSGPIVLETYPILTLVPAFTAILLGDHHQESPDLAGCGHPDSWLNHRRLQPSDYGGDHLGRDCSTHMGGRRTKLGHDPDRRVPLPTGNHYRAGHDVWGSSGLYRMGRQAHQIPPRCAGTDRVVRHDHFIGDYFNALAVGQVARPITGRYRISRAILAYLIDSNSSPVGVLMPLSS